MREILFNSDEHNQLHSAALTQIIRIHNSLPEFQIQSVNDFLFKEYNVEFNESDNNLLGLSYVRPKYIVHDELKLFVLLMSN